MKIGKRIIYDQGGNILVEYGEMEGEAVAHPLVTEVFVTDLEPDAVDWQRFRIVKMDVSTKQPILEEIPLTSEQQRIKELEDELLLASGVI